MTTPARSSGAARPRPAATWREPSDYAATAEYLGGPDATFDPLELAADDGHLVGGRTMRIAGRGAAAVLELPGGLDDPATLRDVVDWLGAVKHDVVAATPHGADDGPAPRVVAVGAFPFDRSAPASLVVPAVAWCRRADGRAWRVTLSGPHGDAPADRRRPARGDDGRDAPGRAASPATVPALVARPPGADYAAAVAAALREIAAGRLSKVVLSRMVDVALADAPAAAELLRALWDGDPAFSPFSVPVAGGRLVGASPELIVSRIGMRVTSHPFAGTISLGALGGDDPAGRLFASAKDRYEHRLLVEEIAAALAPLCADLEVPAAPSVVPLRSDARLGSLIRGTLRSGGGDASALDILALLHPTPAVGGVPRDAALDAIATLEPETRGYWAGVTGWIDAAGDGEWVLAIRSVHLDGRRALVRAGAGIVEGSDPTAELAETTVKLSPVLDALWPGSSALV